MTRTFLTLTVGVMVVFGLAGTARITCAEPTHDSTAAAEDPDRGGGRGMGLEVLEWNQIFIDTLIATNTANSSSQRLGAIVHTAIFDAFNGIEQRYTPIFVQTKAPDASSRRAAVIAAAHTALVGLFPSQQAALDASYTASLAALSDDCDDRGHSATRAARCTSRIERGIAWGTEVAQAVLVWRASDGFSASYPPFTGGTAVGQWRPTPPAMPR